MNGDIKSLQGDNFGTTATVENSPKININEVVKTARQKAEEELIKAELFGLGQNIKFRKTSINNGGYKYWFICPVCDKNKQKLYVCQISGKIACRGCNGLVYKKSRYKGMIECQNIE